MGIGCVWVSVEVTSHNLTAWTIPVVQSYLSVVEEKGMEGLKFQTGSGLSYAISELHVHFKMKKG